MTKKMKYGIHFGSVTCQLVNGKRIKYKVKTMQSVYRVYIYIYISNL